MTDLSQRPALMTADELLAMPDDDRKYELVNGELRVSEPPGPWHGALAVRLIVRLGSFVEAHRLGVVLAESGFVLRRRPDTVRGPDVSFIRADRLPSSEEFHRFFEGAPDFVAEVVSPRDAAWEVDEKVAGYLERGVRLVWVVYPRTQRVVVHTPAQTSHAVQGDGVLDGGDVLPGFRLPLADLFAPLPNAEAPRA